MSLAVTRLKQRKIKKKNEKAILIFLTRRFNWSPDLLSLKLITRMEDFPN